MKKRECVAMLLAGGTGSRLQILTESMTKPAISFGGKYRLIDFSLSNCINSEIDTVGVLTQYQPLSLTEYLGNGSAWDLDRNDGGLVILPPYKGAENSDWYTGTANAVYKNLNFIEQYDPEYVLVIPGDIIYKMDYRPMINQHKKLRSACTIVTTNKNGENIKTGVYLFSTDKLKKYLIIDSENPESNNDFVKNVIPDMISKGEKVSEYQFDGYFKDVKTVSSLWEANMDLLGDIPKFSFKLTEKCPYKTFTKNSAGSPQFIGPKAIIENSIITEGCEVYGTVINSVLAPGVVVENDAYVTNSILFDDCRIESGAIVQYSILDKNVKVHSVSVIGDMLSKDEIEGNLALVGKNCDVPIGLYIKKGSVVKQSDIDNLKKDQM